MHEMSKILYSGLFDQSNMSGNTTVTKYVGFCEFDTQMYIQVHLVKEM